jgi:ribonuclease D
VTELAAGVAPLASVGAIADAAQVEALSARLATRPAIALDSEGDGMFRYRARLCTLQLASDQELAVVDTLATSIGAFGPLFSASGPEKVVHDAAFDARLLAAHGVPLGSVFDTAIAARFLGFAATGLASLLAQLFEVKLPKHMQQADWGERPLPPEAIAYLENDVRYLLPLRDVLLARVRAQEIEAEVREECDYVLSEARRADPEPSPFARVKGAAARPPKERARIYELALARDAIGRELDVPPTRVVPNELLLRLAELEEPTLEEIARRLSVRTREQAARFHDALLRARERADAPAGELANGPSEVPSPSELTWRKRRRELLTGFRTREAAARAIDPQAVLPGHCVNDLVKLPSLDPALLVAVPGLGAARIDRYAQRWLTELAPHWK